LKAKKRGLIPGMIMPKKQPVEDHRGNNQDIAAQEVATLA
jgi:hypothetical protein